MFTWHVNNVLLQIYEAFIRKPKKKYEHERMFKKNFSRKHKITQIFVYIFYSRRRITNKFLNR